MKANGCADWFLRFLKGMLIGSGFILPGISGGALAAVFGLYERMIAFLSDITGDFRGNFLYFLPVGLGGLLGVFLLSFAVSFFLGAYEAQILWFFIGCILGTLPTLWRQAGRKGRAPFHLLVLALTAAAGYLFLRYGAVLFGGSLPRSPGAWVLAGGLIGLGSVVPGLSPSNFLIYLDLYKPLADGIKALDFGVILPVAAGAAACALALSKGMRLIFERAYTGLYHFILGIVLASTAMIVPRNTDYLSPEVLPCAALCLGGILLGWLMCRLEGRRKPDRIV